MLRVYIIAEAVLALCSIDNVLCGIFAGVMSRALRLTI